ncbi:hypothetical protein CYMTET_36412, partial [Cymbomonas tetramitiformis]
MLGATDATGDTAAQPLRSQGLSHRRQQELECRACEVQPQVQYMEYEWRMVLHAHGDSARLGKLVTSRDPSVLAQVKTEFMLTALDAEHAGSPDSDGGEVVIGRGAYLPDGSDEVLAVLQ